MSGRRQFKVDATYTVSMDDTTLEEAKELLEGRFNESLAALERKDDVRIILVHNFDVEGWGDDHDSDERPGRADDHQDHRDP